MKDQDTNNEALLKNALEKKGTMEAEDNSPVLVVDKYNASHAVGRKLIQFLYAGMPLAELELIMKSYWVLLDSKTNITTLALQKTKEDVKKNFPTFFDLKGTTLSQANEALDAEEEEENDTRGTANDSQSLLIAAAEQAASHLGKTSWDVLLQYPRRLSNAMKRWMMSFTAIIRVCLHAKANSFVANENVKEKLQAVKDKLQFFEDFTTIADVLEFLIKAMHSSDADAVTKKNARDIVVDLREFLCSSQSVIQAFDEAFNVAGGFSLTKSLSEIDAVIIEELMKTASYFTASAEATQAERKERVARRRHAIRTLTDPLLFQNIDGLSAEQASLASLALTKLPLKQFKGGTNESIFKNEDGAEKKLKGK